MDKSTNDLLSELNNIISINDFHQNNKLELIIPDALNYLVTAVKHKNITKAALVKKSGIERTYAYHILSGKKKLTREKIIIFSLSAELLLKDVQNILKYSGERTLYPRDRRDSVIIFALKKSLTVIETNQILSNFDLPLLE